MTKIRLKYVHEYRDRNGKVRRYVRRRGLPKVMLPGLPGSPEFMAAYKDAISGQPIPRGRGYKAGSLGDLVTRYYGSVRFSNLSASSRKTYRFVLSRHVERDGHRLVNDLPVSKAIKIIEEIGAERPGMANLSRSVLAAVFEYAIDLEIRKDNPFKRVPTYKLGTRHTWTDEEIAQYEGHWKLGTRERLVHDVLLYTGQRRGDAVKLLRSVSEVTLKQQKTGEELAISIHPALARSIKAFRASGIYLLTDDKGRPLRAEQASRIVKEAARAAGMPEKCTAHGLRKANQRLLAEWGATTKQMQAVSGHKTLRETERYTAQANQRRLAKAAIALLPDERGTESG